jgi:cell division cycle protein 20 (cofactor of APC complex)
MHAPTQLMECSDGDDYVTSVAWAADGRHVSVGTSSAQVQLWDAGRMKQVRSLRGHSARVSAQAWAGITLSTGGRDSIILNHDVRCAPAGPACMCAPACAVPQADGAALHGRIREHVTHTLRGHEQEVCGLKWDASGRHLASGGNDNLLCIWSDGTGRPTQRRVPCRCCCHNPCMSTA